MASSAIATAVTLNNQGARLFANGDYHGAMTRFREAINTVTATLPAPPAASQSVAIHPSVHFVKRSILRKAMLLARAKAASQLVFVSGHLVSRGILLRNNKEIRNVSESQGNEEGAQNIAAMVPIREEVSSSAAVSSDEGDQQRAHLQAEVRSTKRVANLNPSIFMVVKRTVIIEESKTGKRTTVAGATEISATLTFNFALCCHILSATVTPSQGQNYKKLLFGSTRYLTSFDAR
jgi:hypothetical protein